MVIVIAGRPFPSVFKCPWIHGREPFDNFLQNLLLFLTADTLVILMGEESLQGEPVLAIPGQDGAIDF